MKRRDFLRRGALLPVLPALSVDAAASLDPAGSSPDVTVTGQRASSCRRLLLIRLAGGNDGLNALVPFRDDIYYRSRPGIALSAQSLLSLDGRDLGLHGSLADFKQLIDDGSAGIIQNVGYPRASRSHRRATEIWAAGSTARPAPEAGWLGRWADESGRDRCVKGFTLGDATSPALHSSAQRTETVSHPEALRAMAAIVGTSESARGNTQLAHLHRVEGRLRNYARQFERASAGSGCRYRYPDTEFGAALRWTANLIETDSTAQVFHATLGSFESGFSFDTHLHQLAAHKALFAEFAGSLNAFARQLQTIGRWNDTLVMTYSDFGRQIAENTFGGTDHGDAGLMFLAGGRVAAGVHGGVPDLAGARNGGLVPRVDFRSVFSTVLNEWFNADSAKILGSSVAPYALFA